MIQDNEWSKATVTPGYVVSRCGTRRAPIPLEQMPGDQAKVVAAMIDVALAPDPPRRLLLGSDAYRLVRDALPARLAGVEAQKDRAASTDVGD